MGALKAIAMLCAFAPAPGMMPIDYGQIQCQAYFVSCIRDQHKKLTDCVIDRPTASRNRAIPKLTRL